MYCKFLQRRYGEKAPTNAADAFVQKFNSMGNHQSPDPRVLWHFLIQQRIRFRLCLYIYDMDNQRIFEDLMLPSRSIHRQFWLRTFQNEDLPNTRLSKRYTTAVAYWFLAHQPVS